MLAEMDQPRQTIDSVLTAAARVLHAAGFMGIRYYEIATESIPDIESEPVCYLSWQSDPSARGTKTGFAIPWSDTSLALEQQDATTARVSPAAHNSAWFKKHGLAIPDWVARLKLQQSSWLDIPIYNHGRLVGLLATDWKGDPADITPEASNLLAALGTLVGVELSAAYLPVLEA